MPKHLTKKLGEVCEVVGGGTPKTGISKYWDGDLCWVTPKDLGQINDFEISTTSRKITKEGLKSSSARELPAGSVILSSRAPIGYVAINTVPMATNQGCRSFICGPEIYNKYLYYFLIFNIDYLNSLGSGSTFLEVSGSRLKEIEIPLPPLSEQKKIVAKLDAELGKIKEAKRLRQEALADTDRLLPSTLHEIFEAGKAKGWGEEVLSDICEIARGGSPRPIKEYLTDSADGINWIKISDATNSAKYIYKTKEKIKKTGLKKTRLVKEGDLILTNSMSFGHPYIMKTTGAIHDGWLLLRPKESITEEYLYYFLSSDDIYRQFTGLASGGVVQNLNSALVRSVKILIPTIAEQKQIVTKLDKLSEQVKALRELKKAQLADLESLEKAVLREAFEQK